MNPRRPSAETGRPARTFGAKRWCRFCGCRLSVYNPDTACGPCAQQKGRAQPDGRADFPGRATPVKKQKQEGT